MNQFWVWVAYFRTHPLVAAGAGLAVIAVLYFLNRKPRLERQAEQRLNELRKERGGQYDRLRPPG